MACGSSSLSMKDKHWKELSNNEVKVVTKNYRELCSTNNLHELEILLSKYGNYLVRQGGLCYASTPEVIEMLLQTLNTTEQRELVMSTRVYHSQNLLHMAAEEGLTELVRYWITSEYFDGERLLQPDTLGSTALHHSANVCIFKMLLEGFARTKNQKTEDCIDVKLFQYLIGQDRIEVILFILEHFGEHGKKLLVEPYGDESSISLHHARSEEMVKVLLQTISPHDRPKFLLSRNLGDQTALHQYCLYGETSAITGIVEISKASGIWFKLIMTEDDTGSLPFHLSASQVIASMLMETLSITERKDMLTYINSRKMTMLHSVCAHDYTGEIVSYILKECMGKTISTSAFDSMLVQEDTDNEFPLQIAIGTGNKEAVEVLANYLYSRTDLESTFKQVLEHQNVDGQNVIHQTLINAGSEFILDTLVEYCHLADFCKLVQADHYNNSPINYLLGRYQTALLAYFLMQIPLPMRRVILSIENSAGTTGEELAKRSRFDRAYYHANVLCGNRKVEISDEFQEVKLHQSVIAQKIDGEEFFDVTYDEKMWIVVRYSLNEYDVVMSVSLSEKHPPTSDSLAAADCPKDAEMPAGPALFIDEEPNRDKKEITAIRREVFECDSKQNQGKMKVVIRKRCLNQEQSLQLPPPGPDFSVYSVFCDEGGDKKTRDIITKSLKEVVKDPAVFSTDYTIQELLKTSGVSKVAVDCTLTGHVTNRGARWSCIEENTISKESHLIIKSCAKKRALVICYKYVVVDGAVEPREGWEEQNDEANKLLKESLGFQSEDIIQAPNATSEVFFAKIAELLSEEAELFCLVVMGHGDLDGNITDVDSKPVPVKKIIDELNDGTTAHVPKLVLFSFCRGRLRARGKPKANRTIESEELKVMASFLKTVDTNFSPNEIPLKTAERYREWARHPFPEINNPPNCYIMYSTLPDSKSPRDQIGFRVMRKYLADAVKAKCSYGDAGLPTHQTPKTQMTETNHVKDMQCQAKSSVSKSSETKPALLIDIVHLFTDVGFLVREGSGFTQNTNYCYTVDKFSKQLAIQLPLT